MKKAPKEKYEPPKKIVQVKWYEDTSVNYGCVLTVKFTTTTSSPNETSVY